MLASSFPTFLTMKEICGKSSRDGEESKTCSFQRDKTLKNKGLGSLDFKGSLMKKLWKED